MINRLIEGESDRNLPALLFGLNQEFNRFNLEMPEIRELPENRFPIVVVFGPPGSGKTELVKILQQYFGGEVLFEHPELNEFLSDSYNKDDPDLVLKAQKKFLLLKLQSYAQAVSLSASSPVFVDQPISIDYAYAQTHYALGKMSDLQFRQYHQLWEMIEPFSFEGDLGISVIPPREVLDKRIRGRGREFEQAWSDDFKNMMINLCQQEEQKWQKGGRCFFVGDLDYVNGGQSGLDRFTLVRNFGVKAHEVFGTEDLIKINYPESWKKYIPKPHISERTRFLRNG